MKLPFFKSKTAKPKYKAPFQVEMLQDLINSKIPISIMDFKQKMGNPMHIKATINKRFQDLRREKGLYTFVTLISCENKEHIDRYDRKTTKGYYVLNDIDAAMELLEKLKSETI